MYKILIFIALSSLCSESLMAQQALKVVEEDANKDSITISFIMEEKPPYPKVYVTPSLRIKDVPDFEAIQAVGGYVRRKQFLHGRQAMVWNWRKDFKALPSYDKIDVYVTKKPLVPTLFALEYTNSLNSPFGLAFRKLAYWGWYANVRFLGIPQLTNGLIQSDGTYNETSIYKLGASAQQNNYLLSVGVNRKINRGLYAYAGVGYGAKQLLWEVITLNSDATIQDSKWVAVDGESTKGIVLELGTCWRYKRLVLETGIGTIGFKHVFPNLGLGYIFKIRQPQTD